MKTALRKGCYTILLFSFIFKRKPGQNKVQIVDEEVTGVIFSVWQILEIHVEIDQLIGNVDKTQPTWKRSLLTLFNRDKQ